MLAPYLFPDLRIFEGKLTDTELPEQWPLFKANISFYLASMNFYYLLLSARSLTRSCGSQELARTTSNRCHFWKHAGKGRRAVPYWLTGNIA